MNIRTLLFRFFLGCACIEVTNCREPYKDLQEAIEKNNKAQALEIFNNFKKKKFKKKKHLSLLLLLAIYQDHVELALGIIQRINADNDDQQDWESYERYDYKNRIKDSLLAAIKNGHTEVVKELLQKEADPNYKEYRDQSPLLTAAIAGNLEIFKELIQKGADITETDSYNKSTPLIEAARYGRTEILHELLSFPQITQYEKNRGLRIAAANGDVKAVEALLKAYDNIDHINDRKETILMQAATNGHLDVVKKLLETERTANYINSKDFIDQSALFKAVENGHTLVVKELLEIPNIEIDASYHNIAAQKGHLDILKQLLEVQNNKSIITLCLESAITHNHLAIVKELLLNPNNINKITERKQSKLAIRGLLDAAQKGRKEIVKELLHAGADPNIQDYDKNTPLILAARYGHTDVVKLLLEAEANPNIQSEHIIEDETWLDEYPRRRSPVYRNIQMDWTALHYADESKNTEMINLLLGAGANPNIKDAHNRAALSKTKK